MKLFVLITTFILLPLANIAQAGTLSDGGWKPAKCGEKPIPPAVDDKDVDGFNKSVKATNEWQLQARTYFECLINEANTDNTVIADTANKEQADYRKSVETIGTTLDAAKKKLDKK
ncbi:hypothetical protein [Methylomonas sp. AM2-LC]|uniref:hypothetical protein n=1 Tax=Methylomonas sp. AM2-LC TaxID=3153301 RepID=UPI00326383D8